MRRTARWRTVFRAGETSQPEPFARLIPNQVFVPFFTTKARGTGLGLSTAKRLVEAHQGRINVQCPPSGGTVVTVAGYCRVLLLVVLGLVARPATGGGQLATAGVEVTPVQGLSTLHHLGLTIERSSMGWGGRNNPPPSTVPSSPNHPDNTATRAFALSGADLYRISCRSCHKPDGSDSPPEINSLIGPVQAASFEWMTQRTCT